MLLTRQTSRIKRLQLNMAAMIDVVFLLLIFFMCTSSFARPDKSLPTPIPRASRAAARADQLDPVHIRLTCRSGAVVVTCDDQPCATAEQLVTMLKARRALGEPPVIIRGQDDVPFGNMVAALDACYQADLTRAAFAAEAAGP